MKLTLISAVAALLALLAGSAWAAGDAERGKGFYAVCAICHGPNGEGMQEMNAPALAGREEWYLIRQIQNFKDGVRGTDPGDIYGLQMAPMAQVLPDRQTIEDVAAYLASLEE
ncbi:c-type cytochrome [Candidatus Rariloculus sp.]|uniref:c-type cytochrome n=1 Tax=Candidatus Rariloculus sp. TaxID=3101265 RepID=UPI003D12CE17